MIDGVVEETLDLTGVQIDGDDVVRAGNAQQVGDKSRADRLTPFGLPVLACGTP